MAKNISEIRARTRQFMDRIKEQNSNPHSMPKEKYVAMDDAVNFLFEEFEGLLGILEDRSVMEERFR